MRQMTIRVPDNKFQFIVELLSSLKFVKIDKQQEQVEISGEQKISVMKEIKKMKENPGYGLDWKAVETRLAAD